MKGYTEIPFMQMGFFREKKRSIGNRFSIVNRVADPDPVFLHGSGFGSGFQISLDPDPIFNPFATGHIFCLRFGSKSGI